MSERLSQVLRLFDSWTEFPLGNALHTSTWSEPGIMDASDSGLVARNDGRGIHGKPFVVANRARSVVHSEDVSCLLSLDRQVLTDFRRQDWLTRTRRSYCRDHSSICAEYPMVFIRQTGGDSHQEVCASLPSFW